MPQDESAATSKQSKSILALNNTLARTRSAIGDRENEIEKLREKESRALKRLKQLELKNFSKEVTKLQKSLPTDTGFSISALGEIAALAAVRNVSAGDLMHFVLTSREDTSPEAGGASTSAQTAKSQPDTPTILPSDRPSKLSTKENETESS
ncbi:MAG: hypothetical protein O9320_08055 [Magnetospirillum sp.]|nr:hypothetical protein [Magnetospirillum sp.]